MPLQIVRNDITKMYCDAIVNAANHTLLGGGGVDGAIHAAAGPELLEECRALGGCMPGQAKLTRGYRLPARYVIHTVGPVWQNGSCGEPEVLRACYENSLALAKKYGLSSIAFPLISSGAYHFPKEAALQIAMDAIADFLRQEEMMVYLVVYDKNSFQVSKERISDILEYIDEQYIGAHTYHRPEERRVIYPPSPPDLPDYGKEFCPAPSVDAPSPAPSMDAPSPARYKAPPPPAPKKASGGSLLDQLNWLVKQKDESFSQMLLRKIDEKGITDAQCYKRANIDRKLFSKIRKDVHYKPSKPTALAFAVSLELSLEETEDLLQKAGYALSPSSIFDIIIQYFIENKIYDIYEINQALFSFDQSLLGG